MQFDQAIDFPVALQTGNVVVELVPERVRYNLRIKAVDLAAFKKMTALKLPLKMNTATSVSNIVCAKLGPDEWMVIAAPSQANKMALLMTKASKSFSCSITDVSHRNVGFTIAGEGAQALVNIGCPLDLLVEAFPIGKVTRTVFESAQIMLHRTGEDSFHIETWRSFAPYLRDFFERVVTTR